MWLDQLDIVPGQRWDRAVDDALKGCSRLLVILSPVSLDSDNVMDEVSFALEEKKTVIPVVYKDCAVYSTWTSGRIMRAGSKNSLRH